MTKTQINLDIFTKEEIPYTVFTIIYKTDNEHIDKNNIKKYKITYYNNKLNEI